MKLHRINVLENEWIRFMQVQCLWYAECLSGHSAEKIEELTLQVILLNQRIKP